MKYVLFLIFVFLLTSTHAQISYSIISQISNQDTIDFTIRDDANNLIAGKITPAISKDSLINLIASYDGIETRGGISKQVYANVVRRFDSKTISFLIKDGQKFVYQYNDGIQDVLKSGTGLSKIFNEPLGAYTDRVFKDSILLYRYELFEKDTLYTIDAYDENFGLIADQIIDIINNKLKSNEYFHKDLFFVIDENNTLSYIVVSNKEINGRTIKKVRMSKKNRYHFDELPQKKVKRVIRIFT